MISLATKHNDPDARLGWNERLSFGAGRFGMNMINAIMGSFLTIYFTNVALLDAGIIATIIAASKLFDGISDLIIGNIVDHTKSKMGKARSWLFRMCIPFAVSTVLLMYVPQSWPEMVKYVYVFLMYNIVNAVFMTFMFVPFFSMISLITRDGYERGLLGNISEIFSTLGNIVINTFFVTMLTKFSSAENIYTQQAFTISMIIIGVAVVILVMLCVLFTKERVTDDVDGSEKSNENKETVSMMTAVKALVTNKYWLIMILAMFVVFFVVIMYAIGGVYYCQYIFEDMGQYAWMSNSISVAQFGIMFITPFFMKKFGKRAIYTVGMGIGTAVFGWVLSAKGFDAALDAQGVAQPEGVISAIHFLYTWLPLALCVFVFVIMLLFFNLEKKMAEMNVEGGQN